MISSDCVRDKFLTFYASKGHQIVESSSVVTYQDPSILFVNSGMAPLKSYFTNTETAPYKSICSAQKCLRISGKHNDISQIGYTNRHCTFFEMLGNFSFGSYFKESAIDLAFEFCTKILELDISKLAVTIYPDDDEAYEIWQRYIPSGRIVRLEDNFWSMGSTGPCGPCTEIYYDLDGIFINKYDLEQEHIERMLEIWNLVFMQYSRSEDGSVTKLAVPCVDTGMGLERLVAVLNNKRDIYECGKLAEIMQFVQKELGDHKIPIASTKAIVDHIRAVCVLIAEGIYPGSNGRSFITRKLVRRAVIHALIDENQVIDLSKVAAFVCENMGYADLVSHKDHIVDIVSSEQSKTMTAIGYGWKLISEAQELTPELVFKLHDTYGTPLEFVVKLAAEKNILIDIDQVERLMEEQRARSNSGAQFKDLITTGLDFEQHVTSFIGHDHLSSTANLLATGHVSQFENISIKYTNPEDLAYVITERTVFYPESGGQVGDSGIIIIKGNHFHVLDTIYVGKTILHICHDTPHLIQSSSGTFKLSQIKDGEVQLFVDHEKRQNTKANHTATHVLHAKVREILGPHVIQRGSSVGPNSLRLDISHHSPISSSQINEIELEINKIISKALPVKRYNSSLSDAKSDGALSFFGDKYDQEVSVIAINNEEGLVISKELCCGTHVANSSELLAFKIISDHSIAAGVIRIIAKSGLACVKMLLEISREFKEITELLKLDGNSFSKETNQELNVVQKVEEILNNLSTTQQQLDNIKYQQHINNITANEKRIIHKSGELVYSIYNVTELPKNKSIALVNKFAQSNTASKIGILINSCKDMTYIISCVSNPLSEQLAATKIMKSIQELFSEIKFGGTKSFSDGGLAKKLGKNEINLIEKNLIQLLKEQFPE